MKIFNNFNGYQDLGVREELFVSFAKKMPSFVRRVFVHAFVKKDNYSNFYKAYTAKVLDSSSEAHFKVSALSNFLIHGGDDEAKIEALKEAYKGITDQKVLGKIALALIDDMVYLLGKSVGEIDDALTEVYEKIDDQEVLRTIVAGLDERLCKLDDVERFPFAILKNYTRTQELVILIKVMEVLQKLDGEIAKETLRSMKIYGSERFLANVNSFFRGIEDIEDTSRLEMRKKAIGA